MTAKQRQPLRRQPGWPLRLEALVQARAATPFAWGSFDCCLFAADVVQALTGVDPAARLRGTYATAPQALRRLHARGGVHAIASMALGLAVPVALARVGDVVQVEVGGHAALGVCNGTSVLGPSATGLVAINISQAQCAWRVG